jgi:tRNA-modifying protein YgfZ
MPSLTLDAVRSGAVVYLDESRVRIAVTGDDRLSWLNGMLTCNIAKLARGDAAYGCALNVKGKILADAFVVAGEKELGVFVARAHAAEVLELWNKYIVMEDCELTLDESRVLVAVQGGRAAEIAEGPKLDDLGLGGGVVIDASREEAAVIVRNAIAAGAVAIGDDDVRQLRVSAGRATIGVDVDAHHYVQEAGLEARAVSFEKGCYVGQEVVCMLQNRGKVHRRLVQLRGVGLAPGAEVRLGNDVIGKVTSVAGDVALAMAKTTATIGANVDVGGTSAEVIGEAR